jgi:hypothetical protein
LHRDENLGSKNDGGGRRYMEEGRWGEEEKRCEV